MPSTFPRLLPAESYGKGAAVRNENAVVENRAEVADGLAGLGRRRSASVFLHCKHIRVGSAFC